MFRKKIDMKEKSSIIDCILGNMGDLHTASVLQLVGILSHLGQMEGEVLMPCWVFQQMTVFFFLVYWKKGSAISCKVFS